MHPPKHIPLRRCTSCATQASKRDLLRIVRTSDGALLLDPHGKAPGRGAYLCKKPACWTLALKKGSLARAIKAELDLSQRESLLQALRLHMEKVAA